LGGYLQVTKKKTMLIATKEVLISKLGPKKPEIDPGKILLLFHYDLLISLRCIMHYLPPRLEHDHEATILGAGKGEIVSEHYSLLPCDLRNLKDLDDVFAKAELDAK